VTAIEHASEDVLSLTMQGADGQPLTTALPGQYVVLRLQRTAGGPPVYHFKSIIPLAGALVLLQGLAEIVRCIDCLRTGQWPERLKDAEEIDVVEQQLAGSTLVDEESRKRAIESVHEIDEAARTRGMGADAKL
jgi:hypothetical protein